MKICKQGRSSQGMVEKTSRLPSETISPGHFTLTHLFFYAANDFFFKLANLNCHTAKNAYYLGS